MHLASALFFKKYGFLLAFFIFYIIIKVTTLRLGDFFYENENHLPQAAGKPRAEMEAR